MRVTKSSNLYGTHSTSENYDVINLDHVLQYIIFLWRHFRHIPGRGDSLQFPSNVLGIQFSFSWLIFKCSDYCTMKLVFINSTQMSIHKGYPMTLAKFYRHNTHIYIQFMYSIDIDRYGRLGVTRSPRGGTSSLKK